MSMLVEEKEACLKIAQEVGVFKPVEIEALRDILEEYLEYPDEDYFIFLEKEGDAVLGLIIFSRASITEFSWDIYWMIVARDVQGKGIGKKLIKRMEDFIVQHESQAVLRVETSTKHEFAHARNLYLRCNFIEVGKIPHFYAEDDDLIIYYKQI
ncbi:MAG: GNAT family N-acetyltransferase [Candidatus Omnitrophota bacterium]